MKIYVMYCHITNRFEAEFDLENAKLRLLKMADMKVSVRFDDTVKYSNLIAENTNAIVGYITPVDLISEDPIRKFALLALEGDPIAIDAVRDILRS